MKTKLLMVLLLAPAVPLLADTADVEDFISQSGCPGGLIVQVDADDILDFAKFTGRTEPGQVREGPEPGTFLVHGLYTDNARLDKVRATISEHKLGGLITASYLDGQTLPFINDVVNLFIADHGGTYDHTEVMRVLAPRGQALLNGSKVIKPVPANIDDWTHNLYDATNNAVSQDRKVGPPRHVQWVGAPEFCRSHDANNSFQAMVSSAGRIFYIMDEGSTAFLSLPPQWYLTARDGFNGKTLWKKKLPQALVAYLDLLKNGLANLAHRIVASPEAVYVTMGFNAPVSALDSKTGKELWVSEESANAEELILHDGILYCIINLDERSTLKHDFEIMRGRWVPLKANTIRRKVLALDSETGKKLWEHKPEKTILPLSMTVAKDSLFIHDGIAISALDRNNGKQLWKSEPIGYWQDMGLFSGVTMVYYDDIILFSCSNDRSFINTRTKENTVTGLDAKTGEVLWKRDHRQFTGFFTSVDLMVADGLLWSAGLYNTAAEGKYVGMDPRTGQDVRDFPPDPRSHMPHHRCHRNRGTENYLFTGRTGIDAFDVKSGEWSHDYWARGTCRYGMMPANGILYLPPNSCACYVGSMIHGFHALSPASEGRKVPKDIPAKNRLVKEPEFGKVIDNPRAPRPTDWPTLRGSPNRHAKAASPMASEYAAAWKTPFQGQLSQPVVAGGKALVSAIDQHTIYALDENTGRTLWSFLAGGIVNSPPSIWQGQAVFGCNDGWVYSISMANGNLVWKYRVAPEELRLIAYENLASPWPVNGSILVLPDKKTGRGKAYCVAGRSMFLDGGLRMVVLDVASGTKLNETIMDNINPETGKDLLDGHEWPPESPSTNPDILSFANGKIYMGQQAFDLNGNRETIYYPDREELTVGEKNQPFSKKKDISNDHLFATVGFLNGNQWHRGIWYFGSDSMGGCWGVNLPSFISPSGNILAIADDRVYGYGREFFVEGTKQTAHLFACDRNPEVASVKRLRGRKIELRGPYVDRNQATTPLWDWSEKVDIYVRAMVVAENAEQGQPKLIIAAGAPDIIEEYDAMDLIRREQQQGFRLQKIYDKQKAVDGKMGAKLIVTSTEDGKQLSETQLEYPPVFDGMAAANGKVFVSDVNGNVVCLKPTR